MMQGRGIIVGFLLLVFGVVSARGHAVRTVALEGVSRPCLCGTRCALSCAERDQTFR